MDTVKCLPTTYSGVKFRSRTEARWAVFFDRLKVRWLYEHEGYETGSGWYLPDFYLPDHDYLIEIKRSGFKDVGYVAESKLDCAVILSGARAGFLIAGTPIEQLPTGGYHLGITMLHNLTDENGTPCGGAQSEGYWCECESCAMVGVAWGGRADYLGCGCEVGRQYSAESPRIKSAMLAARGFNFLAS